LRISPRIAVISWTIRASCSETRLAVSTRSRRSSMEAEPRSTSSVDDSLDV
jgi:hypothetical protein